MEYNNFLESLAPWWSPVPPNEFTEYIADTPELLQGMADMFMFNLPLPRWKYYEPQNFDKIQNDVTKITNDLVTDLGWFPIRSNLALLQTM